MANRRLVIVGYKAKMALKEELQLGFAIIIFLSLFLIIGISLMGGGIYKPDLPMFLMSVAGSVILIVGILLFRVSWLEQDSRFDTHF